MNKIIILIILLSGFTLFAQVPQGISYQAVAFDTSGNPVINQNIGVKLSILDNSGTGTVVYAETTSTMTNDQGVFSLNIGQGTPITGNFSSIKWGVNNKFLKVEIDIAGGTNYSLVGANQLMSVPYALYSENTDNAIMVVKTIQELRSITGMSVGDIIYVKYHTSVNDGGGGVFRWRNESPLLGSGYFGQDNNGTLIKSTSSTSGRWVREYEGAISVAFFGIINNTDITSAFQRAIDFAEQNANDSTTSTTHPTKGRTVFVPSGVWKVNKITLKLGVDIVGDSFDATILSAIGSEPYLFEMEKGPVKTSVSNFKIRGNNLDKGCFHFKADRTGTSWPSCGLWNSIFKNIEIDGFKGHGIFSEALGDFTGPNQLCIFQNVHVRMSNQASSASCALKMIGQHGQMTFLNCGFNGYTNGNRYHTGHVVDISYLGSCSPAVISFINATIQEGDYGVYLNHVENVTLDNCWFENLGVAVVLDGKVQPCKSINVLNSRFANAAGYGSLGASSSNISNGIIIQSINSQATVANNFVTVSAITSESTNDLFILGDSTNEGIEAYGNSFSNPELSKTSGIMQVLSVQSGGILNIKHNKIIFVSPTSTVIKTINSSLSAGETVFIRANGNSITFNNTNNIFLTNRSTLTLTNGEIAGFTKIDTGLSGGIYQLTSLVKSSSP
ncbi:pectate lyase family protein [Flavobacterium beibuense]|uniref:hypothetical protein n=1 Tax=Flavobacterium beibuense TaxID=657326 RepID=UPI0006897109|nr:hypothetical protein [Flavobacterium beibuense]